MAAYLDDEWLTKNKGICLICKGEGVRRAIKLSLKTLGIKMVNQICRCNESKIEGERRKK
jgi:hypothetical protein